MAYHNRTLHYGFWIFAGVISAGILLLEACSSPTTAAQSIGYLCSVTSASLISSNEVSLNVMASGGTPNYVVTSVMAGGAAGILLQETPFSSSTSVNAEFTSLSTTSLSATTGTVTVQDSSSPGLTATCSFSLGSSTTLTGALACAETPSTTAPAIDAPVAFTFSASGGTPPYTFSNFVPGSGGSISSALITSNPTSGLGSASAYYTVAETVTPTAQVSDAAGRVGTCSTALTVGGSGTIINPGGAVACNVIMNPNPSVQGQSVYATIQVLGGVGSVQVISLNYPTSSEMVGTFTGALSAELLFPLPGSWPITMIVQDSVGNLGSCTGTQLVNP